MQNSGENIMVDVVEIDYMTLYQRAGGNIDEPYAQYEFGNGRKKFMSNFQSENIYAKPYPHAPDPDLVSTNP